METEEYSSRICRLCGQSENMYIDVFGAEGTKRFLGLKIHTKINILIDEKDPLPKAICVQCLGKLEFVCDFQEECLRTQQLLRDQYKLPPLSDSGRKKSQKPEASASTSREASSLIAGTDRSRTINNSSFNNNGSANNNNFNSPEGESSKENEIQPNNTTTKIQKTFQRQQLNRQLKSPNIVQEGKEVSVNAVDVPSVDMQIVKTTPNRRLRSRNVSERKLNTKSDNSNNDSIKKGASNKRLRSRSSNSPISNNNQNTPSSKTNKEQQKDENNKNMIQIPTNTLNKVLSAITNSPGVGVSVKDSANRKTDLEDISFTVQLSKTNELPNVSTSVKSVSAPPVTVLAKVFPDQGSCLVDKTIVTFLEDESNEKVNNLINNITKTNSKKVKDTLIDKLQSSDDISNGSKNPEELYKMDGEEIIVDDNIEQTTENNQVIYTCKLCRKVYERKDKCTVHVKTHLGIKQYMCILCQAKFVCKSDVMKHIRCSHTNPRPILCPKCPKRFRSKFDLAEHNNVHKGIRPYQCDDCGQSYHHKVSLQMHIKSHLPPQNLTCEYCGKIFPYRTRLLSHIGSVHMKARRNFRCRFCYNLYSSLSVLNEHIKTRHAATYTCETCGKIFKVASKYKTHVLQHSNPKPYVCNICCKKYASKAFLNEHVMKHQGLRKHICPICNAKFAQASHLAAHRHVHGDKTHVCPECGKKFNRRDNMKVHRKRHFMDGDLESEDMDESTMEIDIEKRRSTPRQLNASNVKNNYNISDNED